MATARLGIIMNGITGRMGYRQHLVRSVLAIRDEGGLRHSDGIGKGFKVQAEQLLRQVLGDGEHPHVFWSGVRGVRPARAGALSSAAGRRVLLAGLTGGADLTEAAS